VDQTPCLLLEEAHYWKKEESNKLKDKQIYCNPLVFIFLFKSTIILFQKRSNSND